MREGDVRAVRLEKVLMDMEAFRKGLQPPGQAAQKRAGVDPPLHDLGLRVHLDQLARIEKGEGINGQTLLKLCAALDVTFEDLVRKLGQKMSVD